MKISTLSIIVALALINSSNADVRIGRRGQPGEAEIVLEDDFHITVTKFAGPEITNLADALLSAQSSLATNSDVLSAYSVLAATAPCDVLASISIHGFPHIQPTAAPSWFTKLPEDVKSVFISEQSVLGDIVTQMLPATATQAGELALVTGIASNPAPPRIRGDIKLIGAALAGLLGAVAVL